MKAVATLPLYSAPPEELGATRGVEFIEMPVRQILNRCDSPRVPFRWTINPYRGCEFGCVYCYARAEYVAHAYDDRMGVIFDRIRARYGFPIDHERRMAAQPVAKPQPPRQASLSF